LIGSPTTSARIPLAVALCAVVGLVGLGAVVARYLMPTDLPPTGPRPRETLRVATANLGFDNTRKADLSRTLRRFDADLLLALEWTGHNLDPEAAGGPELTVVLDSPSPSPHGVLVLARRRLETIASLTPTPVAGPCRMPIATVRVRDGGDWFSLVGVHAPPPIEECADTNLPTLRFLARSVRDGRLATDLGVAHRGDRVILAGDLNATPSSPGLVWLQEAGLVDTQARDRWLPRGTWASVSGPHLSRLDYVLGSPDVGVVGSWTIDLPGSDHRAVIADLRVPR